MLRILLIIAVALAVIIGLMRLTGTNSSVAPAEESAIVEEPLEDAVEAAAPVEAPLDTTVEDALDEESVEITGEGPGDALVDPVAPPAEVPGEDMTGEDPTSPNG